MTRATDLLLGRIALGERMITREQLFDCLAAQERNPGRPIGEIMIRRRIVTAGQVRGLLARQQEAFRAASGEALDPHDGALLGRLLIEKGLCTPLQVHSCLRLQGRMEEAGIKPVPALGDILIRRGYLAPEALAAALHFQTLPLYGCPECAAPIDGGAGARCPRCGAPIPALLAQMAGSMQQGLAEATRAHDLELPAEVRRAAELPDRRFGKYVLIREVGRGGSGVVWKAWEMDVNRIVALKMLSKESETGAGVRTPLGDAEDLRRFYNETRAITELRHDNIVPILDYGVIDDVLYFTMDFVEGHTLDERVREGPRPRGTTTRLLQEAADVLEQGRDRPGESAPPPRLAPREALGIMRDVARAVQYAHEKGVYHRDLKPSNIMVTPEGRPRITDFGLAKLVRLGDAAYVKGVVMGTPYYMPPEQAEGDMEKVDHLSDVYSLGAVAYEAVTGAAPFGERSPDTVIEMLPKLLPRPPLEIRPDLPAPVARIIQKAMQKEKKKRYASAAAFADDIDRYLAGRLLAPEPDGAGADDESGLGGLLKRLFRPAQV
jgi:serine/threonine protein kinase